MKTMWLIPILFFWIAPLQTSQTILVDEPVLTEAEKQGILLMREEEKLARDVYLTLGETWPATPFEHIPISEQRHMDRMLGLITQFGLTDPVEATADARGVFKNPVRQDLFTRLVQQGQPSKVEALSVGAMVEEIDIDDLTKQIAGTQNQAILTVYKNLRSASYNHLRAFVRYLKAEGGTYTPTVLPVAEFKRILESANEHGMGNRQHQGNGPGNGQGMGNGRRQGNGQHQGNGPGSGQRATNGQGNGQGPFIEGGVEWDGPCTRNPADTQNKSMRTRGAGMRGGSRIN